MYNSLSTRLLSENTYTYIHKILKDFYFLCNFYLTHILTLKCDFLMLFPALYLMLLCTCGIKVSACVLFMIHPYCGEASN